MWLRRLLLIHSPDQSEWTNTVGGGGGVTFTFPILSGTAKFNIIYILVSSYKYLYSVQLEIFNKAPEQGLS